MKVFFWVGAAFFLFGVVDLFFPETFRKLTGNVLYIDYRGFIPSVKSFFIHPGVFGWFMSFLALYCFAYAIVLFKSEHFYSGVVFFLGCFLSMRARSILGLIASLALGFIFVSGRKRLPAIMVLVPIVIIAFILLGPAITDLFESKINIYFGAGSAEKVARNALYVKSVDVALDYFPFGAGMGRYGSFLSKLYYSPVYEYYALSRIWGMSKENPLFITDTFWPMILGETGLLGLLLYLLILLTFIRTQISRIKTAAAPEVKAFHLGTLMIIISGMVESIADPIFTSPPSAVFVLGAIGLSTALSRITEEDFQLYRGPLSA